MSNFKKYLPWEDITIRSELSTTELKSRLLDHIEPRKTFRFRWFPNNAKPYEGYLTGDTFEISRIIRYKNSFKPYIKGRISTDTKGGKVDITLSLHPVVYAFVGIVGLIALVGSVVFLVSSIRYGDLEAGALIPLGILIFLILMSYGGFRYEAGITRKDLERIFQGKAEKLGTGQNIRH